MHAPANCCTLLLNTAVNAINVAFYEKLSFHFADETENLAVWALISDAASTSNLARCIRRFGVNASLPRRCRRGIA